MNWSAAVIADVPAGVTTVMSTVPVPAGLVVTISLSEFTVTELAGLLFPKLTVVALVKAVPVMVTESPPAVEPVAGEMPVMAGGGT